MRPDPLAATVKLMFVPSQIVALVGLPVTVTEEFTVSVAAVVFTVPQVLVSTARYWFPFIPRVVLAIVYVPEVAPGISVNAGIAAVLTCHWIPGAGVPEPAAVNETALPEQTLWETGFVVTAGPTPTVSVAAFELVEPHCPETTTRYWLPLIAAVTPLMV